MVSKEGGKCTLTNSESDSEAGPSMALEVKYSHESGRQVQVRKRNKALQVRFKDICEAQNEQAAAAAAAKGGKPVSYKVPYRKYMTVPARRSIPNVTKSTGVQTSPDLRKRYQTFPFERKKGHTIKHAATVEPFKGQNNGFVIDVKRPKAADYPVEVRTSALSSRPSSARTENSRALLHTTQCVATVEQHPRIRDDCTDGPETLCSDALLVSCSTESGGAAVGRIEYQLCSVKSKQRRGFVQHDADVITVDRSAKRQLLNSDEPGSSRTLPDSSSKVTGPIAWNSLTQVECLESPSAHSKRKKAMQLNGLQSQTLPRTSCTTQAQCHVGTLSARPLRAMEEIGDATGPCTSADAGPGVSTVTDGESCKQIVPVNQDGDLKAQLQAMESMISSSQETIKVLLGVIQELEKGEAHREGLSYRTGQDTANCDTCRNSACIIYSVELDFKQQEDKLQPLMKRLCPTEESLFPPLPYTHEAFTSTPKRKSKAESKKHARWKLWFL
ncbi:inhibitory synaptic factor 2A isoform X2 [Denticeps clupeoides]|uniref:Inhibitory synaptic factor 2A n=2 Tax=Denticeps clupeoides TaxID=299321 RepID=A0AAY4DIS8_9TELE|nr:inhibitory synaptic factor 2A isoform X2 [Denticeps clupeoides]